MLERDVDSDRPANPFDAVWDSSKCAEAVEWMKTNDLKRISLQFPDYMLEHSVLIAEDLQKRAPGRAIFILADTTYCPCCVDEIGAEHVASEGLIHFGHACLTQSQSQLKVFYSFVSRPLDVVKFRDAFVREFKSKSQNLTIFYSTGYHHKVAEITEALVDFEALIIAKLAINSEPDLLNWITAGRTDFSNSQCIYIGPDDQSSFNLRVSIVAQNWWLYSADEHTLNEVTVQNSSYLRKRFFFIEKCKDAQVLGIVHGTVSSKGHLEIADRIRELAKSQGIRTITISVGKLNPAKLANFMDIDCFVLIGCPENDAYTSRDFYKPLVSVFECELALNPLWRDKLPDTYSTSYNEMLPNGKHHTALDAVAGADNRHTSDMSLITGRVRGLVTSNDITCHNGRTDIVPASRNELLERTVADALQERSWKGLEQSLGQTPVATIEQGRSGIPMQYDENPK